MNEKQRKKRTKKQIEKIVKKQNLPIGMTLTFHITDDVSGTTYQVRVRT